jgi:hypothetical protein
LIVEDEHSEIKVIASPEEHKFITTNPKEIKEFPVKKNIQSRQIKINVDENKRFFRKSELNKDEINFLISKGYKIEKRKSLVTNKIEEFLLQPRHNESSTHLFVIHDIKEYLEKKGIEVKIYTTKKPDIVFNIGKKKIAIEVETGAVLTKVSRMQEKLKVLNGYDKWFFVVTNKNKVKNYKKYGDAIDIRYIKQKLATFLKPVDKKSSHSA